jgi:hypothetical protein
MRALLAIQSADDHQRASRLIDGFEHADREALRITAVRIKTKRKPRKKATKSSRIDWLKAVHSQNGAA